MADLIEEGLQVGFLALIVAATPDTCGHAIDVPDSRLNGEGFWPGGISDASYVDFHAARIFTPGAAISGCKRNSNFKHLLAVKMTFHLRRASR